MTFAALLAALALTALALAPPAAADHAEGDRVSGPDRFATAVEVAWANYPDGGVSTAFLANGRNFPDALAASYASGEIAGFNAPVLLAEQNAVPDVVERLCGGRGLSRRSAIGDPASL